MRLNPKKKTFLIQMSYHESNPISLLSTSKDYSIIIISRHYLIVLCVDVSVVNKTEPPVANEIQYTQISIDVSVISQSIDSFLICFYLFQLKIS